jgi:hypothetical protein
MRTYVSLTKITGACPCDSYSDELAFIGEIVDDFKNLIKNYPEGLYPVTIKLALKFESKATVAEKVELSLEGTVIFIYTRMFKEPYPTAPFTKLQRERINAIWQGIGHPENIIPT